MLQKLLLAGLVAGVTGSIAQPIVAATLAADTVVETDDPKPKDDPEKKNQVTYWVLDASGKG